MIKNTLGNSCYLRFQKQVQVQGHSELWTCIFMAGVGRLQVWGINFFAWSELQRLPSQVQHGGPGTKARYKVAEPVSIIHSTQSDIYWGSCCYKHKSGIPTSNSIKDRVKEEMAQEPHLSQEDLSNEVCLPMASEQGASRDDLWPNPRLLGRSWSTFCPFLCLAE